MGQIEVILFSIQSHIPETAVLSRGKMCFLYTMNIKHFTKASTYKLKHSTPQIDTITVQVFRGCVRVGISQSTIYIIELQRSESRSYATVVDIELMKKFPNRDSDWFSNARESV